MLGAAFFFRFPPLVGLQQQLMWGRARLSTVGAGPCNRIDTLSTVCRYTALAAHGRHGNRARRGSPAPRGSCLDNPGLCCTNETFLGFPGFPCGCSPPPAPHRCHLPLPAFRWDSASALSGRCTCGRRPWRSSGVCGAWTGHLAWPTPPDPRPGQERPPCQAPCFPPPPPPPRPRPPASLQSEAPPHSARQR